MIEAEITGGASLLLRFGKVPDALRSRLRQSVQEACLKLTGHVKQDKLSGQVLKVQTGRLRRSINQRIEDTTDGINGFVGTNVQYARGHEYGFTGTIGVRETLRTSKNGKEFTVRAHTENVRLPERSFLRSALADQRDQIREQIAQDVKAALVDVIKG